MVASQESVGTGSVPSEGGDHRRALGSRGEDLAAVFFVERGFQIVARNWRCRDGELDLIIQDADAIRVIEVKTRISLGAGLPQEAVTEDKLERMEAAWSWFLEAHPDLRQDAHFDVLAIIIGSDDVPVYQWLQDME